MEGKKNLKVKAELLDEERIRYIYKSHMKKDFPRAELKPLKSILMLIEQNRGEGYGVYNERELAGYAFLIKAPSGRAYLIDYLAVLPSLRDRGYGSACLRALQDVFGENLVMVESEEPSFAARETERQVRRRRISFYEKNGFFDSRNICRLFGVEYRILGKADCMEEEHRQMRCREELDSIYRTVIPKIAYGSQVKWL